MLRIYNTLSRSEEVFEPLDPPRVSMYVCGPTVYAESHIGHAMSYVAFDVARRYLEYRGYEVRYAQNFTDVDDKIINRARETGVAWDELARKYAEEFRAEMRELNVRDADEYPHASAVVPEIVEDIRGLIERGAAYPLEGDVYFRVRTDPAYGKLAGRTLSQMQAGARVEVDERKEHPMDFALWKGAKPGEPAWGSPWGPGRPGWHIECTTMNLRTFGPRIDIHGGGADLIFPHHENEIAQSEALTGEEPFARYWMHNGLLQVNGEKMSKSVGNVVTIRQVLDAYGADAFRWFVLSSSYRRPINYTEEALASASRAVGRLALAATYEADAADIPGTAVDDRVDYLGMRGRYEEAMDADFNAPQALAVLSDLSREVNRLQVTGEDASAPAALLRELAGVLGFGLVRDDGRDAGGTDAAPYIELLVRVRDELRMAKQWALSDRIRDGLKELGVALEDSPEGTEWRRER